MSFVNKDNILPICLTIILSCFHVGVISSIAVVGGTTNLVVCGFLAACGSAAFWGILSYVVAELKEMERPVIIALLVGSIAFLLTALLPLAAYFTAPHGGMQNFNQVVCGLDKEFHK